MNFEESDQNYDLYRLARANILSAMKGGYLELPGSITRKLDRFYVNHHNKDHDEFLDHILVIIEEMKEDFSAHILEFQKITSALDTLEKYVTYKKLGEI